MDTAELPTFEKPETPRIIGLAANVIYDYASRLNKKAETCGCQSCRTDANDLWDWILEIGEWYINKKEKRLVIRHRKVRKPPEIDTDPDNWEIDEDDPGREPAQ